MDKNLPESIMRDQARQHNRKKAKQNKSVMRKKNKAKKETDVISVKEYKNLTDNRALEKAANSAREWVHLAVRLRDFEKKPNGDIVGHCIACGKEWKVELDEIDGKIKNPKLWCASHYFRADLFEPTRYDMDNIHLSCWRCNKMLGGNLGLYQINLISKIGAKRFHNLAQRTHKIAKYNILDLIKIKEAAMDEVQIQAKRLGLGFYIYGS